MRSGLVLVTGANGFVGKWCVVELLRAGFAVRGTVRSESRAEAVRTVVRSQLGEGALQRLSFIRADLMRDTNWAQAMVGVAALLHVACPVVADEPKDIDAVVGPAVQGTERVFRFAIAAGVKRVVMTSSLVTVGYGHGRVRGDRTFGDDDFTNLGGMKSAWADCIGKTRAERAARAYARAESLRLTTIHPGRILGPALDGDVSASLELVSGALDGSAPAWPGNGSAVVDVRDVAALHVAALQRPLSEGQRYLAVADSLAFADVATILRRAYPDREITSRSAPDWLIRLRARLGGSRGQIIHDIGSVRLYDGSKGEALLGRPYITAEAAVLGAAESLIGLGAIR